MSNGKLMRECIKCGKTEHSEVKFTKWVCNKCHAQHLKETYLHPDEITTLENIQ